MSLKFIFIAVWQRWSTREWGARAHEEQMDIIRDADPPGDFIPIWTNDSIHGNGTSSGDWLSSSGTIALLGTYCTVIFVGVFGNASLVVTLCAQGRLRNPLLVALCVADLIVSGIAAPLTVVSMAFNYSTWSLPPAACKAISFVKVSRYILYTFYHKNMKAKSSYSTVKHFDY